MSGCVCVFLPCTSVFCWVWIGRYFIINRIKFSRIYTHGYTCTVNSFHQCILSFWIKHTSVEIPQQKSSDGINSQVSPLMWYWFETSHISCFTFGWNFLVFYIHQHKCTSFFTSKVKHEMWDVSEQYHIKGEAWDVRCLRAISHQRWSLRCEMSQSNITSKEKHEMWDVSE
jgi:hypothetical protein